MNINIKNLAVSFLALCMFSCEPLDETFKEIDANTSDAVTADLEFTLTSDDYEILESVTNPADTAIAFNAANFENFSSEDDAKILVPYILDDKYPHLGKGSSAKITYDIFRGSFSGISAYRSADEYELSTTDYASVGQETGDAGFFNDFVKAEDNIPAILSNGVSGAADGDILSVNYEYADVHYDDAQADEFFAEDFEALSDLSGFQTVDLEGDQAWEVDASSSGYKYGKMSGFSGGSQPNEDWLILPQIDLTSFDEAEMKLSQVVNFLSDAEYGVHVSVKVSTNFTSGSAPSTATWTDISPDKWPSGDNYDVVNSVFSLEDFGGSDKVTVAFYYKSTSEFAPQWRLVSIQIVQGVVIETNSVNTFYTYDGSAWDEVDDDVYYLASADYDAMGAPGRFNNFSSGTPADDYLPAFLKTYRPFAQEEDSQIVLYDYFSSTSSSVSRRGDYYTFTAGSWVKYESIVDQQLSFGHDGNVWVPDNTIKFTLSGDDLTFIGNWKGSDTGPGGNLLQFSSFDVRSSSSNYWSPEDLLEGFDALLKDKYPSAEVGQKYLISYKIYDGAVKDVSSHFILGDDGAYAYFIAE